MFPTKANDPYIQKNGTRSTLGSVIGSGGGGSDLPEHSQADAGKVLKVGDDGDLEWDEPGQSINWMSQSDWNELTFDEKKAAGFTAIGSEGSSHGTYYDYSNVIPWRYNEDHDNVIDIYNDGDYNFHGFYSKTIGDVVSDKGRGGTRTSGSTVFICNGINTDRYGFFMMFGKSEADLQCSNTSFYDIKKVANYDLYVGSNISGAWSDNVDVQLDHNSVSQNLKDYFTSANYTISGITIANNQFVIPESYGTIIDTIGDILSSV